MLSVALLLTACQRTAPEIGPEIDQVTSSESQPPDLTMMCQNLKTEMTNLDNQRTTLALEQINQNIRLCLPLIDFYEQKQWITLSEQMYANFLKVKRSHEQQRSFESYAQDQSQYPTLQQQLFEKLNSRDQYLLQHQGQAYIELIDLDRNHIQYRRSPLYLAKVFAPYLPKAEAIFVQQLAEQNIQPVFKEHRLNIIPQEIVHRAEYWVQYQKDYPKSAYIDDARYLANFYTALLFKGSKDAPSSELFQGKEDIQQAYLNEIVQLADRDDAVLNQTAKKFMRFIELNAQQRNEMTLEDTPIVDAYSDNAHSSSISQLEHYLDLVPIQLNNPQRDCFSDAICHSRH
ncbi:hypothetical protein EC844_101389 [Acinetobacter calcoaceticus]|uniref:Uncharacterized protein n=1 Tax=Acinetobacter calcoaceticus TaxID=471 RepID=A0A4R1Y5V1_ACICA|nr:hypothetical protein EC844_101389 [Acinetobacter calcoaceticus]